MKRRFDLIASKHKSHADDMSDMNKEISAIKKSLKAVQQTVQSEKAIEMSDESLGLPFKTMAEIDKFLSNAENEKKLLEFVSTIDKDYEFICRVHSAILDHDLMQHCYVSEHL